MFKLHKNLQGFTAVEFLLVIVILGIVGTAGYYVAKHLDKKTPTPVAATTSSVSKTLTIKEWGVKLNVGSVADASYKLVVGNEAFLTTASMERDSKCVSYYSTKMPAMVALVRGSATDSPIFGDDPGSGYPATLQAAAVKYPNSYFKIGNYYYYTLSGNGISCGNVDENKLDIAAKSNLSKIQLVQ